MSRRFETTETCLPGVFVLKRMPVTDDRGHLDRLFCSDELQNIGFAEPIAQINHTMTREQGVVRGMHFQRGEHAEIKVISCLAGEVFDVAVDLRPDSSTYGQWFGRNLSCENREALIIPKGCAHGFQTLTPDCQMLYFHSRPYAPDAEGGVSATDPEIGIDWPLDITFRSRKDTHLPSIKAVEHPDVFLEPV